jgi:hypothetical protein
MLNKSFLYKFSGVYGKANGTLRVDMQSLLSTLNKAPSLMLPGGTHRRMLAREMVLASIASQLVSQLFCDLSAC